MATLETLGCINDLSDDQLLLIVLGIRSSRRQIKAKPVKEQKTPTNGGSRKLSQTKKSTKELTNDQLISSLSADSRQSLLELLKSKM